MPVGDPLEEATVMIVGRGPLYPRSSVAIGERFGMLGALSVETAARHLNSRDIDGIVIGDGFSQRMVEAFLTVLAQDDRFRHIPVVGRRRGSARSRRTLPNVDRIDGDPDAWSRASLPPVRLHAFEARLKRMLAASKATASSIRNRPSYPRPFLPGTQQSHRRSWAAGHALSIGALLVRRRSPAHARPMTARGWWRGLIAQQRLRLPGRRRSLLIGFGQTDLRSAHLVARRMAAALRRQMLDADRRRIDAHVTLATLKGTDTLDPLLQRVDGGEVVAAE